MLIYELRKDGALRQCWGAPIPGIKKHVRACLKADEPITAEVGGYFVRLEPCHDRETGELSGVKVYLQ